MLPDEYRTARDRWLALSPKADRDEYFALTQAAVAESYLADPSNPYRQSGRSSGAARWEETRRCLVRAIHRDGDFMDVGCANGLLLETLIAWSREAGFTLTPHGLDFVPELIELARRRFPEHGHNFIVANAFFWEPAWQYDYVRTNLEYVPTQDWVEFVQRQHRGVVPGGRLIVCHYRNEPEPYVALKPVVEAAGLSVENGIDAPGVAVVWSDRPINRESLK
jgi:2-polyprenyl-3-methyl-5-hydroxy-6-metoxy-1,4-benzoquinol methylase